MIQHVEIGGKKYPFYFGMREILEFSSKNEVEFDEVGGKISLDFDLFLELYEAASKKGARKAKSELVEGAKKGSPNLTLTATEIEDAIDNDPSLFVELQKLFENSHTVKELQKQAEGKAKPSQSD